MALITVYPTVVTRGRGHHRPHRPPPTRHHPGRGGRHRGRGLRGRQHRHLRRLRPGARRPSCPLFIGLVVVLSFLLLAMVFRSIVIPLTAAAMNLLSIGAAFGVLVAVFQWGWLGSVFQVGRTGPVEAFLPVMLFAILFGLSMDYEVFLISRIQEEWLKSGDNATAVRNGPGRHRQDHHRGRPDHDPGVRLVHPGWHAGHQGVRPGPGRRHLGGRLPHPDGHRARADVPVRQGQLVVPGVARPDPAPPVGRSRAA